MCEWDGTHEADEVGHEEGAAAVRCRAVGEPAHVPQPDCVAENREEELNTLAPSLPLGVRTVGGRRWLARAVRLHSRRGATKGGRWGRTLHLAWESTALPRRRGPEVLRRWQGAPAHRSRRSEAAAGVRCGGRGRSGLGRLWGLRLGVGGLLLLVLVIVVVAVPAQAMVTRAEYKQPPFS